MCCRFLEVLSQDLGKEIQHLLWLKLSYAIEPLLLLKALFHPQPQAGYAMHDLSDVPDDRYSLQYVDDICQLRREVTGGEFEACVELEVTCIEEIKDGGPDPISAQLSPNRSQSCLYRP